MRWLWFTPALFHSSSASTLSSGSVTINNSVLQTRLDPAHPHTHNTPALLSDAARIGSTALQNHKRLFHHVHSSDRALYSVKGSVFSISVCHLSPIQTKNIQRLSQKSMLSSGPRSMKEVNNVCWTYFIQRIQYVLSLQWKIYIWKHTNTVLILRINPGRNANLQICRTTS